MRGTSPRMTAVKFERNPLYVVRMNSQDAIATLRRCEPVLRARGIRHAAVFDSIARGDNRPGSDLDIMIDIDPEAHLTLFD